MIRLFVFLLAIVLTISAHAQPTIGQKLQIGPTVGLNVATTTFNKVVSTDPKYDYNIGTRAAYPLGQRIKINSLLVYSRKGIATPDGYKETYEYVDVPIFLSYTIGTERFNCYPLIGVQQGWMLSSQVAFNNPPRPSLSSPPADARHYELAVNLGIGSQFRVAPNASVFFDIRYASGLTGVQGEEPLFSRGNSIRNRVLSFNTGVLF